MPLPPPTTKHKVLAAVILFLLLPAGCVYMLSGEPDPAITNRNSALVCVKQKIMEQLKAPSTAEFQASSDMIIETTDNLSYKIGGYVDAENGFGAKIRTHFICSTTVDPATQTCVTDCSIDQ